MGNDPEKVLNVQKTNPKSDKGDQEMSGPHTMLDPARPVPTMCHHKLRTAIVISLALSNF